MMGPVICFFLYMFNTSAASGNSSATSRNFARQARDDPLDLAGIPEPVEGTPIGPKLVRRTSRIDRDEPWRLEGGDRQALQVVAARLDHHGHPAESRSHVANQRILSKVLLDRIAEDDFAKYQQLHHSPETDFSYISQRFHTLSDFQRLYRRFYHEPHHLTSDRPIEIDERRNIAKHHARLEADKVIEEEDIALNMAHTVRPIMLRLEDVARHQGQYVRNIELRWDAAECQRRCKAAIARVKIPPRPGPSQTGVLWYPGPSARDDPGRHQEHTVLDPHSHTLHQNSLITECVDAFYRRTQLRHAPGNRLKTLAEILLGEREAQAPGSTRAGRWVLSRETRGEPTQAVFHIPARRSRLIFEQGDAEQHPPAH